MRPTSASKHTEKGIIRCFAKETFQGSLHVNDAARESINEKTSCGEGITPKSKRDRGMRKKSKASFDKMSMFAFSGAILLVRVRT
jgi:hypothetical protein